MTESFHVLIIGGGVAGLALAQALRREGISFAVFERDQSTTERLQGYRVHMKISGENAGEEALMRCLDEGTFNEYLATAGPPGSTMTFYDSQFRELAEFGTEGVPLGRSVSRLTLRNRILMKGLLLNENLFLNKKFVNFRYSEDTKKVTAYFEDGTQYEGDILVGADGANSLVRQQLLPYAQRIETGVYAITAKVRWTPKIQQIVTNSKLRKLYHGALGFLGPDGWFFFTGAHCLNQPPIDVEINSDDDFLWRDDVPYLFFALNAPAEKFTRFNPTVANLNDISHDELYGQVLDIVSREGWDSSLLKIVEAAEKKTMLTLNIKSSVPIDPWRTSGKTEKVEGTDKSAAELPITLMGDALHSMTPYQGIGVNIALGDSFNLFEQLQKVKRGEKPLLKALGDFENEMCQRGFQAVYASFSSLHMCHYDLWWHVILRNTGFRIIDLCMHPKRLLAFGFIVVYHLYFFKLLR